MADIEICKLTLAKKLYIQIEIRGVVRSATRFYVTDSCSGSGRSVIGFWLPGWLVLENNLEVS